MKLLESIRFSYLYRDASNYKAWGEIVFSNPEGMNLAEIDTRLRKAFDTDGIFTADQIQVPAVFLYKDGKVTSNDHCYHEFDCVELSSEKSTDLFNRSMKSFIEQVERASQKGWRVFNPVDWLERINSQPR